LVYSCFSSRYHHHYVSEMQPFTNAAIGSLLANYYNSPIHSMYIQAWSSIHVITSHQTQKMVSVNCLQHGYFKPRLNYVETRFMSKVNQPLTHILSLLEIDVCSPNLLSILNTTLRKNCTMFSKHAFHSKGCLHKT